MCMSVGVCVCVCVCLLMLCFYSARSRDAAGSLPAPGWAQRHIDPHCLPSGDQPQPLAAV